MVLCSCSFSLIFFANDSLIFFKASLKECDSLQWVIIV